MPTYEHRQFSPWPLLVFALVAFALARFGLAEEAPARLSAFAFVAIITISFTELATRVDVSGISWSFTLGLPSGHIAFEDISDAQMTTTHWWEGFGIHWTILHGWLWNVAGFQGVTIRKRDGSAVTIGTDDPQGLYDAIRRHRVS